MGPEEVEAAEVEVELELVAPPRPPPTTTGGLGPVAFGIDEDEEAAAPAGRFEEDEDGGGGGGGAGRTTGGRFDDEEEEVEEGPVLSKVVVEVIVAWLADLTDVMEEMTTSFRGGILPLLPPERFEAEGAEGLGAMVEVGRAGGG